MEFYPTKIQITKGKLADYNTNSEDGGTLVSQAMKDAIETIDVDIHQFIPVEVLDKDGKEYGGQYYYWNIGGEVLDAVNYEQGGVDSIRQRPIDGGHAWKIKRGQVWGDRTKNDLAVSKDIIKGRGVWRDLRMMTSRFVSDALVDVWKEAGLTGWDAGSDWDEV